MDRTRPARARGDLRFSGGGVLVNYQLRLEEDLVKVCQASFDSAQAFYDWINEDWTKLNVDCGGLITRIEMGVTVAIPNDQLLQQKIDDYYERERLKEEAKRPKPPF